MIASSFCVKIWRKNVYIDFRYAIRWSIFFLSLRAFRKTFITTVSLNCWMCMPYIWNCDLTHRKNYALCLIDLSFSILNKKITSRMHLCGHKNSWFINKRFLLDELRERCVKCFIVRRKGWWLMSFWLIFERLIKIICYKNFLMSFWLLFNKDREKDQRSNRFANKLKILNLTQSKIKLRIKFIKM